jgi:hypothetical protein
MIVFMGMFMLVVLPLALFTAARIIGRSDFGKKGAGKFVELMFYIFTMFSILGSILILVELI